MKDILNRWIIGDGVHYRVTDDVAKLFDLCGYTLYQYELPAVVQKVDLWLRNDSLRVQQLKDPHRVKLLACAESLFLAQASPKIDCRGKTLVIPGKDFKAMKHLLNRGMGAARGVDQVLVLTSSRAVVKKEQEDMRHTMGIVPVGATEQTAALQALFATNVFHDVAHVGVLSDNQIETGTPGELMDKIKLLKNSVDAIDEDTVFVAEQPRLHEAFSFLRGVDRLRCCPTGVRPQVLLTEPMVDLGKHPPKLLEAAFRTLIEMNSHIEAGLIRS